MTPTNDPRKPPHSWLHSTPTWNGNSHPDPIPAHSKHPLEAHTGLRRPFVLIPVGRVHPCPSTQHETLPRPRPLRGQGPVYASCANLSKPLPLSERSCMNHDGHHAHLARLGWHDGCRPGGLIFKLTTIHSPILSNTTKPCKRVPSVTISTLKFTCGFKSVPV